MSADTYGETTLTGALRAELRERMEGKCSRCGSHNTPARTVTQVSRESDVPRATIYRFLAGTSIMSSHLDRIAAWLSRP